MQNGWGYQDNSWYKAGAASPANAYPFEGFYECQQLQWGNPKMDKVLVIEDEPSIAVLLASIIEDYGYEVTTAFDGKQGFELARTGKYKLVITDNMLPYMTGREICARLKHEPAAKDTIIILMSAVNNLAEPHTEAAAFLSKPFDISTVDELVQHFLGDPKPRAVNFDEGAAYLAENYHARPGQYRSYN